MTTKARKYREIRPVPGPTLGRPGGAVAMPSITFQISAPWAMQTHPGKTFDIPTWPAVLSQDVRVTTRRRRGTASAQRRSFPLSQHIIDHIIDSIAFTSEPDEFPKLPWKHLAACSLISRAFLPRSSHHLFRRTRFVLVPGQDGDGAGAALDRVEAFLAFCRTSSYRLQKYVTGLSLQWKRGAATPPTLALVERILAALPNLVFLRFFRAPGCPEQFVRLPPEHARHNIHSLQLDSSDSEGTERSRVYEQLRFFRRIQNLYVACVREIADYELVPKTRHLVVPRLEIEGSRLDVCRVVQRVVRPSAVRTLVIKHCETWTTMDNNADAVNELLEACGPALDHFVISSGSCSTSAETGKTLRLLGLRSCTRLDIVTLRMREKGWRFSQICHNILSCLPPSVRRIRLKYTAYLSEVYTRLRQMIDWRQLEGYLAHLPRLEAFDIMIEVDALEWWPVSENPELHKTYEEQEAIFIGGMDNWLTQQQLAICLELSPKHKRLISFDVRLIMIRAHETDEVRRHVVWKLAGWNVTHAF